MNWAEKINEIEVLLSSGMTLEDIGEKFGVTKQRMYQVLQKFGISTPIHKRKSFLSGKPPKYYWLNRMLTLKKLPKEERTFLLSTLDIPDHCPIFNIPLNYEGTGREGFSRGDNSPSIDRIDSRKGYTKDNIHIISWRANRIKNDSTPEELRALADYMEKYIL